MMARDALNLHWQASAAGDLDAEDAIWYGQIWRVRESASLAGTRAGFPGPGSSGASDEAIYGEQGVKAGYTTGKCQSDITAAIDGLISQGVEVVILGCTELPLLLPQTEFVGTNGNYVRLVDPTNVLARQCVAYATASPAPGYAKRSTANSIYSGPPHLAQSMT